MRKSFFFGKDCGSDENNVLVNLVCTYCRILQIYVRAACITYCRHCRNLEDCFSLNESR